MGQQQLLLLVLGIVIVGLAVVAGINAFDENQRKSSEDALTNEAFRLASDAKAWYNKPTQYDGGGSKSSNLNNISWEDIGVEDTTSNSNYETPWGIVDMTGSEGTVTFNVETNGADNTDNDASDGNFGTVTFNPNADEPISFERSSSSESG